ncbi:zinc uptake protein ZrgA [Vibrio sp.]|uniref:zinc uptake protein ZrgA n=1 Tax=Vibrio sp. TaxID=678 RepID=UPI003D0C35CD
MNCNFNAASLAGAAVSLLVSQAVLADNEFIQHSAHEHGQVEFNIALQDHELMMEILSPASDIVGFEHPPENSQQQHKLDEAMALLNQADMIVTLPGAAQCQLEMASVGNNLEGHIHATQHPDEQQHDHAEHHDEDDHHAAHQEHKDTDHGNFHIEYHFNCQNASQLDHIDTHWFEHFQTSRIIQVNLLTDTQQTSLSLTGKNTRIKL